MGRRATRFGLAASESICRIFNVYDLYVRCRRSSSTIRRIIGSLTPTIDANFHNDYRNQRSNPFNNCGDPRSAFFREEVTLPRWHTGTFVELF